MHASSDPMLTPGGLQTPPNVVKAFDMHSALLLDALVSVWMLGMAMGLCLTARMSTASTSGKGHFGGGGGHEFEF